MFNINFRKISQLDRTGPFSKKLAEVLFWVTPMIWSSNYIIARAASGVIPPHILAFGRWAIALILMIPLIWSGRGALRAAVRTEWHQMLVLGALGTWICGAFVYLGGQSTSAGNIGLIYAAAPIGIAIVSSFLNKEVLSNRQRAAMICALVGVLFIISKGNFMNLLGVKFVSGDLWILAATAAWIAYTVLQQRWPTKLRPIQRLFCTTVGGLLFLFPFAAAEMSFTSLKWYSGEALFLILLAGALPGLMGYVAYSFMVEQLGATRSGLVLYLSPVYATFIAWWILSEQPHWFHLVGALLVLPSIYLASSAKRSDGQFRINIREEKGT
ncbi:Permease of the drug/metabolite transporter (DMT) superfamily [Collimonas sp. OK607]|uniref:DMT family transporter n=1 Tax=Collimonas sp. OK607 TaxID=1798194 RepID=UPI0008DEDF58|nr:DMT family transporter [Collimonas sp. OK607]SFB20939.1 Permease of the drug/metabolite transporter (DMT) superfamily [Collimonas sp. OK607]